MSDARTIASLYSRRRNLLLGLADFERRAEVYRRTIAEVEAELRAMGCAVSPFVQRSALLPIKPRDFRWLVLRHLRASNTPVTPGDLARKIIAEAGADVAAVFVKTRQRVRTNLAALAGLGLAQVVANRPAREGGAVWEMSHP